MITSTFAHAEWHLSHGICPLLLAAGLYAFTVTRPRWPPSLNIPIASPFLVNGAAAAVRECV
jgi:hypothetical protein